MYAVAIVSGAQTAALLIAVSAFFCGSEFPPLYALSRDNLPRGHNSDMAITAIKTQYRRRTDLVRRPCAIDRAAGRRRSRRLLALTLRITTYSRG